MARIPRGLPPVWHEPLILFLALVAVVGVAVLTACNTTEGAGKDIKSVGKGIEESAHDNK